MKDQNTVLVIDDNHDILNLLLKLLKMAGFKVLIAQEGEEGIKVAKRALPDLILLDLIMPGMDGLEVCQHLKSQPDTQEIPIILMTALTETVNKVKGLELGAVDYITKPFQHQELLARINTHLKLGLLKKQLTEQNQNLQQAQSALKDSHERLIAILNSLEALVYVVDIQNYEILFANQHLKQLLNEEHLVGKICWKTLHKEKTGPCQFCNMAQLKTDHTTGSDTWEFQHILTKRWFYIHNSTIQWIDGQPALLEIATDVTQRKHIEEALRASEERFELAMRGANDGLWDWNLETNEVYYSPRWKQLLGYAEHELNPHAEEFLKRLHPDDKELIQEQVTAYLEKKIPTYEATFRMQHRHGHYVWILSRGIAVWTQADKANRFVGTHVDITAQKQTEEALSQAKQAAEVANLAKSAFLANMSHELRTPLNGILGYTQILGQDNTLKATQRDGIRVIQRSGESLLTLINDILEFSKIEANSIEIIPTAFYLETFLEKIHELIQMRAQQKGIIFHYQVLTPLPTIVNVDETRLRQILINLLGNAIKFTEQGSVTFKVSAIQTPNSKHWKIRFLVSDTGIGIAQPELSQIFLPFQQVGERNYQEPGTGLGLTLTQKLVEMMGGQLHVESSLEKGSTFWIEIDSPEVSSATDIPTTIHQNSEIIGFEGASRTILVVDVQWENRSILTHLLTPLGFKVVEAVDGQESIDKAQQIQPEVILMDLEMHNGFEATRQLRKIPKLKKVVIIAISANVFDFQRQPSMDTYWNDFIMKPFHKNVLLDKLQKHLNLKWIYHENQAIVSQPQPIEKSRFSNLWEGQPFQLPVGPNPEQADFLFDLTLTGDIESIIDYVEQLEQTDTKLHTFSVEITKLAEDFQINKISEIVKYYKEAALPTEMDSTVPTVEQAAILFDLAMKGDVYGLRDYLGQLEQNDAKLAPFTKKIRRLSEQFQYEKIFEILEPYRFSDK